MPDETKKDRRNQSIALGYLKAHLEELPIGTCTLQETRMDQMASHDAKVYVDGMYVGIVEVKCINYSVDELECFYVENETLRNLKQITYVEGHGFTKRAILAYLTLKDQRLHVLSIPTLAAIFKDVARPAPDATDDHGNRQTNRKAWFIPIAKWKEILHD